MGRAFPVSRKKQGGRDKKATQAEANQLIDAVNGTIPTTRDSREQHLAEHFPLPQSPPLFGNIHNGRRMLEDNNNSTRPYFSADKFYQANADALMAFPTSSLLTIAGFGTALYQKKQRNSEKAERKTEKEQEAIQRAAAAAELASEKEDRRREKREDKKERARRLNENAAEHTRDIQDLRRDLSSKLFFIPERVPGLLNLYSPEDHANQLAGSNI